MPEPHKDKNESQIQRPLIQILKQPACMVAIICAMLGYGVMSFVMTATPLAMKHNAYVFADTSAVIQWHVLAMFAPSFISGILIEKLGELKIMLLGGLSGLLCVFVNLSGTSVSHFWLALVLLGVSWNFLYVGSVNMGVLPFLVVIISSIVFLYYYKRRQVIQT